MSLRLGIVVVYVVPEESSRLLEIHLERIARHASLPYTIHGCAPRILPRDRALLESGPEVRLTDLPPTSMRGSDEHSYYLERLIEIAFSEGATHAVTLHLDSFPVRDGWDRELIARLSDNCAFASLERINTACLLFPRAFHDRIRPTLLVSAADGASDDYHRYFASQTPNLHSGIGYGFSAWRQGLSWHALRETTAEGERHGAGIYDDALFHLKGAVRLAVPAGQAKPPALRALGSERFETLLRAARMVVPERVRLAIRARFGAPLAAAIDDSRVRREAEQMLDSRVRLFADPDGYVEALRGRGAAR